MDWWPTELPNSWSPTHGWALSWLLPTVAIGVALAISLSRRLRNSPALTAVLVVAALLAVVNYHDYGLFRYDSYLNEWEVYHYYVGSKYASELGYNELYEATLIADDAGGRRWAHRSGLMRDLRTVAYRPAAEVLADAARVKGLFSKERWAEFVHDITWFKAQLPQDRWSELLRDHGYNGTPAWGFTVGALVSNRLDIASTWQRGLMLALDPLLLCAMFGCVAWAYGLRAALFMVIFVGTHYLMSWGHLKGALLRTDFAVCIVLAACLLRKRRHGLAGVFMGWAILSRVFPVFFLAGPGARALMVLIRERRVEPRLAVFFGSCGATMVAVVAGSLVYYGGAGVWQEWWVKITEHYVGMSHWNVGYQPMVDVMMENGVPELVDVPRRLAEEPDLLFQHYLTTWGVRAAVLVPALVFARDLEDDESLAYGFVGMFFMVAASYYYFIVLCVPLLFFLRHLEQPSRALGLCWMFLTGMAGYLFFTGWDPLREDWLLFRGWKQYFQTYYFTSWMVCGTALHMVVLAAARARALDPAAARAHTAQAAQAEQAAQKVVVSR